MRTIQRVEVLPVLLPMCQTFTFASGSAGYAVGRAPHVFVKVTDSEAAVGWGEGRPAPQWSYETLETVTATLRRYLAPAAAPNGSQFTDEAALAAYAAREE